MTRGTRVRIRPLCLAMFAALALHAIALPAMAQDSGVGVDLHFGNELDPSGSKAQGCDADGLRWLRAAHKRSPSGHLYPYIPNCGQSRELAKARNSVGYGQWGSVRLNLSGGRHL